jgi:hypothetical protein
MRALTAALLFLIAAATSPAWAEALERAHGISIHMLPRRVADLADRKWGLVVDYAEYLKPEPAQPVLQSQSELLAFIRKQDSSVQANGVWIVTTHPDAYSEQEKRLLEDIKAVCRKERIPLFITRASQLPAGWQRYDDKP